MLASILSAPAGALAANLSEQISALFFLSFWHTTDTGAPFLSGVESSRLIGSM